MVNKMKWLFIGLAIINIATFSIVNLTKEIPIKFDFIRWVIILELVIYCHISGRCETRLYPEKSIGFIVLFNFAMTMVGLVSRFIIEFGEISNVYNFTMPNMLLHILVSVGVTWVTWMLCKKKAESKRS